MADYTAIDHPAMHLIAGYSFIVCLPDTDKPSAAFSAIGICRYGSRPAYQCNATKSGKAVETVW